MRTVGSEEHPVRLSTSAVDRQSLIRDRVHSEGSVTVDQLGNRPCQRLLGIELQCAERDALRDLVRDGN